MGIFQIIKDFGQKPVKSFFAPAVSQYEVKEKLIDKGFIKKSKRDNVEKFLSDTLKEKASIDYGLYLFDESELITAAKNNERELKAAMQTGKAQIINRYNTQVQENADPGIYGYSTRNEVRTTRGDDEIERWLTDPKVRASFQVISAQVFSDPLTVEQNGDTEEASTLKQFINTSLDEMDGNIRKTLKEALVVALSFQNAFFEKIPAWSEHPDFKGKRIVKKFASKRPGLLEFITDDYDNVLAIHSLVCYEDFYPVERFFTVSFNNLFSNPYGDTVFAGTYKFWKAKILIFQQMAVYANRYANPIPTVTYKDGDQAGKAQEISNKLYAGLNIALPEGVKADFLKALDGGSSNPFTVILEYLDKQISLGICGIDLSQGSYAADKVIADERTHLVSDIREDLEDFYFEQVIKPECANNYDNQKYTIDTYPRLKFKQPKPAISASEMTSALPVLIDGDFIDPDRADDKNYIRTFYNFNELTQDEIEEQDQGNDDELEEEVQEES